MGRRAEQRRAHRQSGLAVRPSPTSMPDQPIQVAGEVVFRDQATGETGVMRQRRDAIFEFHTREQPPRPVGEPGRYVRADRTRPR